MDALSFDDFRDHATAAATALDFADLAKKLETADADFRIAGELDSLADLEFVTELETRIRKAGHPKWCGFSLFELTEVRTLGDLHGLYRSSAAKEAALA